MPKYDRFLIAPINTGLERDLKPFLIPDDAFARLNNAYIFRGRVRKRFGSYLLNGSVDDSVAQLYSRLRVQVGTTNGAGNIAGVVPGVIYKLGQNFSIGNEIFTVTSLLPGPQNMLDTGAATVKTFNINTGAFVINGAAALTAVYFYPMEPVMGFVNYETASINDEPTFAFDTQFSYEFTAGAWTRLGTAVWTGSNFQFFWGTNYRGASDSNNYLFVTNFNAPDLMKYWDGATWTNLNPLYNTTQRIMTARLIVPFKDRLVLLNTIEQVGGINTPFVNRVRFSQNGDPTAVDAFREDIAGKGGYLDAATKEAIITCEFLKDRLIVYFERSTWELAYTSNDILPFRWQQINTELGAESTFSVVPFDKVILGVGNVGIHACNGANVERIDEKIPDEVFAVSNDNEGVFRVFGIRDYSVEMVYWTFPSPNDEGTDESTFPNRILVYNYRTGSWAFNDDSITAFGYFQNQDDITWSSTNSTWEEFIDQWNTGALQAKFRQVIAGNQQGFTFIVDPYEGRNAPALSITGMGLLLGNYTLFVVDHNLQPGDFIAIENTVGITFAAPVRTIFEVDTILSKDAFTIIAPDLSGTYLGGGTIARVSNIDILTKQFNFYLKEGRNISFEKADFYVDRTANGQITVDYFPSSSNYSMVNNSGNVIPGTSVLETTPYALYPFEQEQDYLWHPIYMLAEGETIQLRLYFNDVQISTPDIAWSDFQLNGMMFYTIRTSSRFQ